jgi:hypothetical protein
MVFSDLWVGRAVKTILAPKFGGPAQRWGMASLGGGGAATKLRAPASPPGDQRSPPQSEGLPMVRRPALPIIGTPNMGGGHGSPHKCPPSWGDFRGDWGGLGRVLRGTGWVHGPPPPLAAPPNFF